MPVVLVISRYFPPLSSAGASIRLVKLMKYASVQGWSFSVLTQDPDHPVIPEKRSSEFLLSEIPSGTELIRIGNPSLNFWIGARLGHKIIGTSSLPWGVSVFWRGWKKLHISKIDLIFVNSPPFTNVAVGSIFAMLSQIPLVVDMKDDWVGSIDYWKKGRLCRYLENWCEKMVMRKASAVITVSHSSFEGYSKRYSSLSMDKKISLIYNGEDLEEYQVLLGRRRKPEGKRFRLLSAAAGYRPDYRDLTPVLQALEMFIFKCPQVCTQIEIEFLGDEPDSSYKTWLERLLPKSAITYSGTLNRNELVEHLWQADLFFLVQPRGNFTSISSTLFEYWSTGKAPILLFAETGASSNLVTENHLGEHFLFDQIENASRYIEGIFHSNREGNPIWIERTGVEAFDRRNLAQQMCSIWSGVLKKSTRL